MNKNKATISLGRNSKGEGLRWVTSPEYNYVFNEASGFFQRWGKTQEDDPTWSPFGPEIMDIEISDGESCPMTCAFCYKGNKKGDASKSNHMSLDTFKQIFSTFPKTVTQIAFGITSIGAHPEIFGIFQHCRDNHVVPNVTINGMDPLTDEQVQTLCRLCGAMAVSVNKYNKEQGLNLIKRLTDGGCKQINIHYVISKQTIGFAYEVLNSMKNDVRLANMNAIVFLGLKPKERGQNLDILPVSEYIKLVNFCLENNVRFGFDSCSAPRFDKAVGISNLDEAKKKMLLSCSERCESGLFSAYVDCTGKYWHCSFGEGMEVAYGIDLTKIKDFTKEVWLSKPMTTWREKLFSLNRECPLYAEIHVDEKPLFPHQIEAREKENQEAREKLAAKG